MEAVVAVGNRVVPEVWGVGSSAPKKLGSRFDLDDDAFPGPVVAVVGLAAESCADLRALLADETVAVAA
jgi:hypothetical protein